MEPSLAPPKKVEFYHRLPENFLLVENEDDGRVVIRAVFDNYSERRKALFIRELASEGFIPDEFQFLTNTGGDGFFGVRWIIDNSWLAVPAEVISMSYRRACELYLAVCFVSLVFFDWIVFRSCF
jgi:hypothetical protein